MYKFIYGVLVGNATTASQGVSTSREGAAGAGGGDARAGTAAQSPTEVLRSHQQRARQEAHEQVEMEEFLQGTTLGFRMGQYLQLAEMEAEGGRGDSGGTAASDDTNHLPSLLHIVEAQMEELVFEHYKPFLDTSSQLYLSTSEQVAEESLWLCAQRGREGCSALSPVTTCILDRTAIALAASSSRSMDSHTPAHATRLPIKLLRVLLARWHRVTAECSAVQLLQFAASALPAWCALVKLDRESIARLFQNDTKEWMDECVAKTLRAVARQVLGRTVGEETDERGSGTSSSRPRESPLPLPAPFLLHRVLYLLLVLFTPAPRTGTAASRATGMTNAELMNHVAAARKPSSPPPSPTEAPCLMVAAFCNECRETLASELAPILLYACKEEANMKHAQADDVVLGAYQEILAQRTSTVVSIFQLLRYLPWEEEKWEWLCNMVVSAMRLLVGRVASSATHAPARVQIDFIIPQLSAGLALLADMLAKNPVITMQTMNSASFNDNVSNILAFLETLASASASAAAAAVTSFHDDSNENSVRGGGAHTESAESSMVLQDQHTSLMELKKCSANLKKIVLSHHRNAISTTTTTTTNGTADSGFAAACVATCKSFWSAAQDAPDHCAAEDTIDEAAHCFLRLLDVRLEVRQNEQITANAQACNLLDQLHTSLLRAFLSSTSSAQEEKGVTPPGTETCPSPLLYKMLLKYATRSYARCHQTNETSGRQKEAALGRRYFHIDDYHRLVAGGLYAVLTGKENRFHLLQCDSTTQFYALRFIRNAVCSHVWPLFTKTGVVPNASMDSDSKTAALYADRVVPPLNDVDEVVSCLLSCVQSVFTAFVSQQRQQSSGKDRDALSPPSCSLSHLDEQLSCYYVVLLESLYGANADDALAAMLNEQAFMKLIHQLTVAPDLFDGATVVKTSRSVEGSLTSDYDAKESKTKLLHPVATESFIFTQWFRVLLDDLVRDSGVRRTILTQHPMTLFTLLRYPSLQTEAVDLLASVLTYSTSQTATTIDEMHAVVTCLWAVFDACVDMITSEEDIQLIEQVCGEESNCLTVFAQLEPADKDEVLRSLLRSMRRATHQIQETNEARRCGPLRSLQGALFRGTDGSDYFVRLVHRISLPWRDATTARRGLVELVSTLVCLVKGNPTARAVLFRCMSEADFVLTVKMAWMAAEPENWRGFAQLIMSLVFESDVTAVREHVMAGKSSVFAVVQNPRVLTALARTFASLTTVENYHLEALSDFFNLLQQSWAGCPTGVVLASKCGLFDALCPLLLLLRSTPLSSKLHALLITIASTHIDVRQLKQFLLMIINEKDLSVRRWMVSTAAQILSAAASNCLEHCNDPRAYLALRRGSGQVGVKATLQEFPLDGYTVSMWTRIEAPPQQGPFHHVWHSLYSLQSVELQSVFTVLVSPSEKRLRLVYGPAQAQQQHQQQQGGTGRRRSSVAAVWKGNTTTSNTAGSTNSSVGSGQSLGDTWTEGRTVEANLEMGGAAFNEWHHIAIVHRRDPNTILSHAFHTKSLFQLYVDGVEIACHFKSTVEYPSLPRGFLLIGARSEDIRNFTTMCAFSGQLTAMYFFVRPLSAKDIVGIFSMNVNEHQGTVASPTEANRMGLLLPPLVAGGTSCASPTAPTKGTLAASPVEEPVWSGGAPTVASGDVGVEKHLADQALVCIDPRLNELGQLYNLSSLLSGKTRESRLVTYEGTIVCNTTSIIDAMGVLGAMFSVVLPLSVLTLNIDSLPFSNSEIVQCEDDYTTPNQSNETLVTRKKEKSTTLIRLLKIVKCLASVSHVRDNMQNSPVLTLLSYITSLLGPMLSVDVPEQLMQICMQVLPYPSVFETTYAAFFLSTDLLHSCPIETQLIFINAQRIFAALNAEACTQMRSLGAQKFAVTEMMRDINNTDEGASDLRVQWMLFFETLTVDPITMEDAKVIHAMVEQLLTECTNEEVITFVLKHVRLLLQSRPLSLSQMLGRNAYAAALLPFIRDSPSKRVRLEAILQFLLLTSRSKRTQELMNTHMAVGKEVVHTTRYTSLVWLPDFMQTFPVDTALYLTFRAGLVGNFHIPELPETYSPLQPKDVITFAPVIGPLLRLLKRSTDNVLKAQALKDLSTLLQRDSYAWRHLLQVQGWYILLRDLVASVTGKLDLDASVWTLHKVAIQRELRSNVRSDTNICDQTSEEVADEKPLTEQVYDDASYIMSETLYQVLTHESYGDRELHGFILCMQERQCFVLLQSVLCRIADRFRNRLFLHGKDDGALYHMGAGSRIIFSNLLGFLNAVEDVLFYSATATAAATTGGSPTARQSSDEDVGGPFSLSSSFYEQPLKYSYEEWEELVLVPQQDGHLDVQQARHVMGSSYSQSGEKAALLQEPDGRWLHMALALKVADLLSVSRMLLNYECAPTGQLGATPAELFARTASTLAGAGVTRTRRGGMPRLFCRLLRVASMLVRNDKAVITALVALVDRFVELVDTGQGGGLAAIIRRTLVDLKEHSSLAMCMSLFWALHDLMMRRLRTPSSADTQACNFDLMNSMKSLMVLHKRSFEQMSIFVTSLSDESLAWSGSEHVHKTTLQWLTTHDIVQSDLLLNDFVEVASRADYNVFLERCVIAKEKEQISDKTLSNTIQGERKQDASRLRSMLLSCNSDCAAVHANVRLLVDESLKRLRAEQQLKEESNMERSSSMDTIADFLNVQTASKLNMVLRLGAWTHFISQIRGTIWNRSLDTLSSGAECGFVRLFHGEEQLLVHRRIVPYPNGTNHRKALCPGQLLASAASRTEDISEGSQLRLRGGEDVLLACDEEEEDELAFADDGPAPNDDMWNSSKSSLSMLHTLPLPVPELPDAEEDDPLPEESACATATNNKLDANHPNSTAPEHAEREAATKGGTASGGSGGAAAAPAAPAGPNVFSVACEIPYMMHCWSATLTLCGTEVAVLFDDVNTSYNQVVAEEAKPYIIQPKSFAFSVLQLTHIAPGRRFRMRRTAMELWLHGKQSYFIVFSEASVMRTVVEAMCQATLRQEHRLYQAAARFLQRGASNPHTRQASIYVFQENMKKEPLRQELMNSWRNRQVTNFDYLLWLNFLSGRSLNDLTQYPVFPWVLADYTSETLDLTQRETFRNLEEPIGICGSAERKEFVQHRYDLMKEMGDVPFHFPTHYSSVAVVLYYLVRLEPYTTLNVLLQGGHFDHANRMFHSIGSTFKGLLTSHQDSRELIPELFYMPELCVTHNDVYFGKKQDGTEMGDLNLPPWAHNSPYEFVYHMRAALESDYVSANLHSWIDLIFGCKQRGQKAIEAHNVYNWHTYEDLDRATMELEVDPQLLLDSYDNIGQTPMQVFRRSHVQRRPNELADPLGMAVNVRTVPLHWGLSRIAHLSLLGPDFLIVVSGSGAAFFSRVQICPIAPVAAPPPPTAAAAAGDAAAGGSGAAALAADPRRMYGSPLTRSPAVPTPTLQSATAPMPKVTLPPSMEELPPTMRNYYGSYEALSFDVVEEYERRMAPMPSGVIPNNSRFADGPCVSDNIALLCFESEIFIALGGLFDHSVVLRPLSGLSCDMRLRAHSGRVVRLTTSGDSHYMITGAEDTTFVVWLCRVAAGRPHQLDVSPSFIIYGHEDNPSAVAVSSVLDVVATASVDGVLFLHSLGRGNLEHTLHHPQQYPIDRILIQSSCYVPNVLFASNKDHVIHQYSLNGEKLRTLAVPGQIGCWAATEHQFLLINCVPLHNGLHTVPPKKDASSTSEAITPPSSSVLYVHSFFLNIVKSVNLPADCQLQAISCHTTNPQVIVGGSSDGRLVLLRSSRQQSSMF